MDARQSERRDDLLGPSTLRSDGCNHLDAAIRLIEIPFDGFGIPESTMAATTTTKPKRVILEPEHPPDSFDRAEMRKVIKELAAARRRRKKKPVPSDAK